ncbi:MAG: ABC transporter substrate-binding protein [Myxococcota bacterium]|nr:ABC transporter substrate-binding protein [Myxococcota bacterium]
MPRGFLKSVISVGLMVVLFFTTVINCWQNDNMEERQLEILTRLESLEQGIANGTVATSSTAASPSGGVHGVPTPRYVSEALKDPKNLLEADPTPWLPPEATVGGTLRVKFGSDPKGFNFLTENGADVSEIQAYVGVGMVRRHMEDDSKWAPDLAYYMAEEIADKPSLAYDGKKASTTLSFTASTALASSTITIVDASGTVVRTIDGGALAEGEGSLSWDGKIDDGSQAPKGFYTFAVTGKDAAGADATAEAVLDTPVTYVFKLRKDFSWHRPRVDWSDERYAWLDGPHSVTANDIRFMLDMLMNEQVAGAAPLRSYFSNLASYEATDDYTFEITFSKRNFQQQLMVKGLYPMPEFLYAFNELGERYDEAIIGTRFDDHWYNPRTLGAGPYEFAEFRQGEFIRLERNPNYPYGGNAHQEILISILKDQSSWARKLYTEELHISNLQPSQYRSEVLEAGEDSPFKDGTLTEGEFWSHTYFYIGWNADQPWFGDKKVRLAMSHAFNADFILNEVFLGMGERATGPMPSFLPYYNSELPPIPFDLEKAAALLDEAGWVMGNDGIRAKDGVKFEFTLTIYGNSDEYLSLGNIFKEDLAQIGVNMTVSPMEWANLLKKVDDREFDAITLAWVSSPDVDFYQIWHSSQADVPKGSNRVGFRNEEADELIVALQNEFDYSERLRIAKAFHELCYDEQPYTFFYTRKTPVFWQTDALSNVQFSRTRPYMNPRPWYLTPQ